MGLSVYYPKDIEKLCYDAVIVCVLKNNDEILATWRAAEYPEEKLFFLHTVEMLNGVNERIYEQKVRQIEKNFPLVYKEIQSRIDQYLFINQTTKELEWGLDYSLIRLEGSHYVVAWVPIELLYTESRQSVINIDATPEWEKHHASTENIPLIGFKSQRILYDFFSHGSELPRV